MSSWVSHLPVEAAYAAVIGHGLNEREPAAKPRLTQRFVQDRNADPTLPVGRASIDAALICVGVQYLQDSVAVLREVARVLVPGGPVIISFSNRCFPTKAWPSGVPSVATIRPGSSISISGIPGSPAAKPVPYRRTVAAEIRSGR